MTQQPAEPTPLPQVAAAIEDLLNANRELLAVVDSLSDSDWDRYVPYRDWTVKDLVAHAVGDMSPSGPGLIHAGVLTPEFIAETARGIDTRSRSLSLVEERRRLTREDLRQMLFHAYDAFIGYALRLDESHLPVLDYPVPMGPGYEIKVLDWLWHGYYPRRHADDIRRALAIEYGPVQRRFLPEIEATFGELARGHEGFLRAVYSVADDAWEEPVASNPQWTNKDLLAHLAANDLRPHVRLRAILGEADAGELAAVNSTDEWNEARVAERRGRSVRQLVDELHANRDQMMALLARMTADNASAIITMANGSQTPLSGYLTFFHEHESTHAGQLVPASRARRDQH
jgi:hypothetical protein